MHSDFSALVQRDHDDFDSAVDAMVVTATPVCDLPELLDVARLALAVHVATETRVLDGLAGGGVARSLRTMIELEREGHARLQSAVDSLAGRAPGSEPWYEDALELRIAALDHGSRSELMRWSLHDHVPLERLRRLAADYATERMRVLMRTSPELLAREMTRSAIAL